MRPNIPTVVSGKPAGVNGNGTFYLQSTEDAGVLHALVCGQLSKASAEDVEMPQDLRRGGNEENLTRRTLMHASKES